jgi:predicted HicB family RNase H-like nuclease
MSRARQDHQIIVRMPAKLPRAIGIVAKRQLTSMSEYVRQAVIHQLRREGLDIEKFDGEAAA